jgi:pyridoxamine 5'-phosphate oxidase family protein
MSKGSMHYKKFKENQMSNFTAKEIEYLQGQRLGRLATVNAAGEPHVVPVSFRHNAELDTIDIGGRDIAHTKKYRDAARHGRVAIVVDDVLPPWQPRGIEIRGRAEVLATGGKEIVQSFAPEIIRIHPTHIIAWGIEGDAYHASSRKVE